MRCRPRVNAERLPYQGRRFDTSATDTFMGREFPKTLFWNYRMKGFRFSIILRFHCFGSEAI